MPPEVSFLVPVASPAPFLPEALHSIVAQSRDSWDVVVVMDGPDAVTEEVARSIIPARRLTLTSNAERAGAAAALNIGLAQCRADLIARIDADDRNWPQRLELQLAALRHDPDAVMVGSGARLIDDQGRGHGWLVPSAGRDVRRSLLSRNRIVHSTALIRREPLVRIGGYNGRCVLREDYELWLRLACLGVISSLADVVVDYRRTPGQSSRSAPPPASMCYVGAARYDLARTLSVSTARARAQHAVWCVAQNPVVAGRFGRLSDRRRPADGVIA
ncbi:glycosyltransferase [Nocardioides aurantiacus]|uniref:glycosyltransferase n=1 Tax=Nocardioides aurantiacus TaxID=86796 RepID=UPI00403F0862